MPDGSLMKSLEESKHPRKERDLKYLNLDKTKAGAATRSYEIQKMVKKK